MITREERIEAIKKSLDKYLNSPTENEYEQEWKKIMKGWIDSGISHYDIHNFICLRNHPDHAWGATRVTVNGEPATALGVPYDEDGAQMEVIFVTPTKDMTIVDHLGRLALEHNVINMPKDKAKLN